MYTQEGNVPVRVGTEACSIGISGVPLDREVGAFSTEDDSVVVGRAARCNGVTRQTRVSVDTDGGALLAVSGLCLEVLGIGAAENVLQMCLHGK